MSIDIMRTIFKNEHDITDPTDVLVLLCMADWCNDEGVCFPKIKTICQKTRLSQRTIYAKLKDFEEKGWVSRENREGTSNIYTLCIPPAVDAPPQKDIAADAPTSRTDCTPSILTINNHHSKELESKKEKPHRKDPIHDSLVLVTKYPAGSFNGAVTAKLRKANPDKSQEWIANEILRRFGPNGLWPKNDWRGQQGQNPTPMQVFQEWDRVLVEKKKAEVNYNIVDLMNP
jgi:Fe2+ or Zn2+ uptake regulation protein